MHASATSVLISVSHRGGERSGSSAQPWREDSSGVADPIWWRRSRLVGSTERRSPWWCSRSTKAPDPGDRPHCSDLPMLPTTPARATHDYERNGTATLRGAGRRHGHGDHRHQKEPHQRDFIAFEHGQRLCRRRRACDLDNCHAQDPRSTAGCCATAGSTSTSPDYGSWMNLVERGSPRSPPRSCSAPRIATSKNSPRHQDWAATWNENPRPFVWTNRRADRASTRNNGGEREGTRTLVLNAGALR